MALTTTVASARSPADSPYRLEPAQVLKASEALLKHMREAQKQNETKTGKKNLLTAGQDGEEEDSDDANSQDAQPVWMIFTAKKNFVDEKVMKPKKIGVPHTLNAASAVSSICLITAKNQRVFKDVLAHPSFPKELGEKIRVHGVDKVQARYKSFEQRRQLRDEHDIFLADDRIITMLPNVIGKALYKTSTKRPIPVMLSAPRQRDASGKTIKAEKKILSNKRNRNENEEEISVAKPEAFAREIERALSSAQVYLSPSPSTSIRVGFSNFTAKQLAENVEAVVKGMVEHIVAQGWRNVKAIHIKGDKTISLPIWLADEMWHENEVIEDEDAEKAKGLKSQKDRKRKNQDDQSEAERKPKRLGGISQGKDDGFSAEIIERREKLRQQKREAKKLVAAGA